MVILQRQDRDKVLEFYKAFKQEKFIPAPGSKPTINERVATLKLGLIAEEFNELVEAVLGFKAAQVLEEGWARTLEAADYSKADVVKAADATADMRYVIAGFEIEAGIDSDAVFTEVHNSNMSKLDHNGNPIISDGTDGYPKGKILKSESYFSPEIDKVLNGEKQPVDEVRFL